MMPRHWFAASACTLALAAAALADPPYKALIVTGQNGHDWKATTPILKKLLEETELFTVDVATLPAAKQDMSTFQPKFADYNVVVLNYQGDDWPKATQEAFVNYVENGGGVVVYHFACAAFPNWKEYNRITGLGGWGGRNEKSGPYVRLRDGAIVRDTKPGIGGNHGPAQQFQIVGTPTRSSRNPRAAGEVHAVRRRALRLAPGAGRELDRARHGLRSQESRRGRGA